MSKGFRQSQSFLHTWSGLILGWVLFIIFVAGTIAFWREGLNRWTRPEADRVEQPLVLLREAQQFLQTRAPAAKSWTILMPSAQSPGAQTFWQPQPKPGEAKRARRRNPDTQALIGVGGRPIARETRGGEFFYRFHFDLYYMPVIWARWLVGVAALAMLVAILSGIVTHKKIFRDFFTLRRGKGQRSWLDGHNATAVLALPFHLMITYTGLVTLMAMLMPWTAVANYAHRDILIDRLFPGVEEPERAGIRRSLVDLGGVVRDAERRLGGAVGFIVVREPGDAAALITVSRSPASMLSSRTPSLAYNGTTGKLVWQSPLPGGASETAGAMIGLHAGRYADYGLRWLYFLSGVGGSLMIASGLVLWTVKRRDRLPDPRRPHFGFRLVEWLNVGVVAGFPFAIGIFFWANRLLPMGMKARADWEVHALFIGWALAITVASLLRAKRAWTVVLAATGVLLLLLPVYDQLATARGLIRTLAQGDYVLAGIDLAFVVFGLSFVEIARRIARHRQAAPRTKMKPRKVPVETMPNLPEFAE